MLPFEFIANGPPVSQQTRSRARLRVWKSAVQAAARQRWRTGQSPVGVRLKITVVYYHEAATVSIDNDNMVKPIQDALVGLVYSDDRQITDTRIRKTNIDGRFAVRGMSPVLAEGFVRGVEFIYVRVAPEPDPAELL